MNRHIGEFLAVLTVAFICIFGAFALAELLIDLSGGF